MPRLFIAIELPDSVRKQLAAICHGIEGAKWANPDQLHLTLRFIGEADNSTQQRIARSLATIRARQFEMNISGTGTFPPQGRKPPRVLWAGVSPNPALMDLQQHAEAAMQQCGLPPEGRRWSPHITLARFKHPPGSGLQRWLETNANLALPPIQVTAFHLFGSERKPEGAIHTKVRTYSLVE